VELYFAYGSNLLYEQMRERCSSASFGTLAYYPNFKLDFTRKSTKGGWVADMVFDPNNRVWGAVYALTMSDMLVLDQREVVHLTDGYLRQKIVVFNSYGEEHIAWAYFVKIKKGSGQPRLLYMNKILKGARQQKLPVDYIDFLESIKTTEV